MTDPIKLDPEKTAQIDATAAQIRDLLAKRPPPCAETRRQAATIVAAALASATAQPQQQPAPPPPPRRGPAPSSAVVRPVLVLVGLWLSGCAPVGVAADAARQQALLCAGNATGPGRCQEVRNVEADNAVCWDAQVYTLTGEHALPPEVLAQVAAVVSR